MWKFFETKRVRNKVYYPDAIYLFPSSGMFQNSYGQPGG